MDNICGTNYLITLYLLARLKYILLIYFSKYFYKIWKVDWLSNYVDTFLVRFSTNY